MRRLKQGGLWNGQLPDRGRGTEISHGGESRPGLKEKKRKNGNAKAFARPIGKDKR